MTLLVKSSKKRKAQKGIPLLPMTQLMMNMERCDLKETERIM